MITAYNKLYLNKARSSLARMLDYAVHDLHYDAESFFDLFLSSGTAAMFERGDVRIIAGMSGIELAFHVLSASGITAERTGYRYTASRSKEYWTGWALAQYQWERALPFAEILHAISMKEIIAVCDGYRESEIKSLSDNLSWMDTLTVPDHMNEANYNALAIKLDEMIAGLSKPTSLKQLRMQNGLSQSQLAAASGIPVRTIQQYEQRQKDINKASFETIIKLAAALSCEPSQLIEIVLDSYPVI